MSANRQRGMTPEDRRRAVLGALAHLDGAASVADIADATGIAPRTLTDDLRALAGAGLVTGDKHRRRLTPEGWAEVDPGALPVAAGSFDEAVREVWPAYHAAFVRLMADAVVIRSLDLGRSWHPSFAATGSSGTGKTVMAEFICWAFGLDETASVRMTPSLAPGELLGRRSQVRGAGHVFDPSPLVSVPFALLDEWGQAEEKIRRESLRLLDGKPRVIVEGAVVDLRATVMVAYNPTEGAPDPRAPLREPYWRRCLVIHTDAAGSATSSLPEKIPRFYAAHPPAPYDLGTLALPYRQLPDGTRHLLVDGAKGMLQLLTGDGRLYYGDTRGLEALALGRIARHGLTETDDAAAVVLAVAYDVLTVADTIPGHVVDGWRLAMAKAVKSDVARMSGAPGAVDLETAIATGEAERAALDVERAGRHQAKEKDSLALTGDRAATVARFKDAARAIERVPAGDRATAAGLRAQLKKLSVDAGESRSAEALAAVDQLGASVLAEAQTLRRRIDDDKRQADACQSQQKADARAATSARKSAEQADRERNQARRRQEKAGADKQKAALRKLRRLLKRTTTRPGEDVAGELVALGVIRSVDVPYQKDARKGWQRVSGKPERWVPKRRRMFDGIDGRRYWPDELATWQTPAVRSLLGAAVAHLDRAEGLGVGHGGRSPLAPPALPPGATHGAGQALTSDRYVPGRG